MYERGEGVSITLANGGVQFGSYIKPVRVLGEPAGAPRDPESLHKVEWIRSDGHRQEVIVQMRQLGGRFPGWNPDADIPERAQPRLAPLLDVQAQMLGRSSPLTFLRAALGDKFLDFLEKTEKDASPFVNGLEESLLEYYEMQRCSRCLTYWQRRMDPCDGESCASCAPDKWKQSMAELVSNNEWVLSPTTRPLARHNREGEGYGHVRVLRPEEVVAERLAELEEHVQKLESRDATYGPIPMPCPNHRSLKGRDAAKSSDAPIPPHLRPIRDPEAKPGS